MNVPIKKQTALVAATLYGYVASSATNAGIGALLAAVATKKKLPVGFAIGAFAVELSYLFVADAAYDTALDPPDFEFDTIVVPQPLVMFGDSARLLLA